MVKVSICIPTYKELIFLKQCLDSIVYQTYTNYEVIVSDDTPDDSVKNLIGDYKHIFQHKLLYKKNKSPLGSPENWNEAIRMARGELIKIMHHDDFFTYNYSLQEFVNLMDLAPKATLGFSSSFVNLINISKTWIHTPTAEDLEGLKKNSYSLFFKNCIGAPSATIFRRNSNLFFDKNLKWVVDFEFYSRIINGTNEFVFNSKDLITTIGGENNITHECINNENIEIVEYIYFYNKIPIKRKNILKSCYHFNGLFNKYGIKTIKEIRACGYLNPLPLIIYLIILKKKINTTRTYGILRRIFRFIKSINNRKPELPSAMGEVIIGKDCDISDCKFGKYNKVNNGSYLYKVNYSDYTYSSINVTMMNCDIGKFCSIAQGVCIGLGMHPINDFVSTHPSFYSIHKQCGFTFTDKQYFNEMGKVAIGNDVWIGVNSIILDNIKIGNGAVIAANSFVTTDIPPYAIYGGSPAKLIKYRFSEEIIVFLQRFNWWDKDTDWLQKNYKDLHNIKDFMQKYSDNC